MKHFASFDENYRGLLFGRGSGWSVLEHRCAAYTRRAYLQACFLGHGFQDVIEQILKHTSVVEVLIRRSFPRGRGTA